MKNCRLHIANHSKHCLVLMGVSFLALSNSGAMALAGAQVELRTANLSGTPINAPNPGGTWNGGETLLVEMWIGVSDLPNGAGSLLLRSAQVNYSASAGLGLGQDIDAAGGGLDGIGNFWFDYSTLPGGDYPAGVGETGGYVDFSEVAVGGFALAPSTVYMGPSDGAIIALPAVQSPGALTFVRLGAMPVALPTVPGNYTLDLLHTPFADDFNEGTTITFGFGAAGSNDPFTIWSTATDDTRVGGSIAYAGDAGPVTFTVVPEPATVALLLAVAAFVGLRRKNHTNQSVLVRV